ncbi:hypothetical protein [Phytohabitans rumicis]|uniref:Uncharacterized protein n=1 Tax=Phytohabitans rumicis TaxID=1076125 RepID=A0A6V8L291_9ACTN|nr:hypothetical protein [Phytohabitans rumicis]GFJ86825.1 hypothetical protein Prum_004670 [Phytohabitans rumicis]
MTHETTTDSDASAAVSYGGLFLPVPDVEKSEQGRAVPDDSEAAMTRLRAPFEIHPVDAAEPRG